MILKDPSTWPNALYSIQYSKEYQVEENSRSRPFGGPGGSIPSLCLVDPSSILTEGCRGVRDLSGPSISTSTYPSISLEITKISSYLFRFPLQWAGVRSMLLA